MNIKKIIFIITIMFYMLQVSAQEHTTKTLNFKNAPLESVLDYLSKNEGFVILYDDKVENPINISDNYPTDQNEIITILNSALSKQGYVVIRNGRKLKIVTRSNAIFENLPIMIGNDPEIISNNDDMITQIIPINYIDGKELVDNLKPFLKEYAVITYNSASNSIILVDTQSNVRRIIKIINYLDQSLAKTYGIKVFDLSYTDAVGIAKIINELFQKDSVRIANDSNENTTQTDPIREQATNIIAVASERTNSVIVKAPLDIIIELEKLIKKIDIDTYSPVIINIFPLKHADAEETSDIIVNIFNDNLQNFEEENTKKQYEVTAASDIRTNSVVVSASKETMKKISNLIESLDSNLAKDEKIYIYSINAADGETIREILNALFDASQ